MLKRKLRFWNGRGHGKYIRHYCIYVAAYTIKQASELVGRACGLHQPIGYTEITQYYSECWGNPMKEIATAEPGVWVVEEPHPEMQSDGKPKRVL